MIVNVQKGGRWEVVHLPRSSFQIPSVVEIDDFEDDPRYMVNPRNRDSMVRDRRYLPITEIRGEVPPGFNLTVDRNSGQCFYALDDANETNRVAKWEATQHARAENDRISRELTAANTRNAQLHAALIRQEGCTSEARVGWVVSLVAAAVMTFIAIGSIF